MILPEWIIFLTEIIPLLALHLNPFHGHRIGEILETYGCENIYHGPNQVRDKRECLFVPLISDREVPYRCYNAQNAIDNVHDHYHYGETDL